jgi:4-diphosphocytidyl-2-C-methyl-D-erythritol kinase
MTESGTMTDTGPGARIHVVRFAPAKLNLTLAVVGRRDDGYHSLHSVMVPLCLGDALTVSAPPPGATNDLLKITGLPLPVASDNMVLRAIAATREAVGTRWPGASASPPPLAARLAKRIPVAAGLGGGSSDAAAAIAAALAAWSAILHPQESVAIAASLGSDVPFFLDGGSALVTGRGEFVDSLPDIAGEQPAILLVTPRLPLSTAAVFKAYSGGARPPDEYRARTVSERLDRQFRSGLSAAGLMELAPELASANDLVPAAAAVVPGLQRFVNGLAKLVDRPVCQSGSGPTLWVLYLTLAEARRAARLVRLAAVNGTLPLLGTGEPFVTATTIAGRPTMPTSVPTETAGAIGPRTVHNWRDTDERVGDGAAQDPVESKGDQSR